MNSTKKAKGVSFELFLNLLLEYCLQSKLKLEQKHAKINERRVEMVVMAWISL